MSDCTCVRGDDGQVRVPRSRCPQHGWVDTPTPAPALTDEQIDELTETARADFVASAADEDEIRADHETFARWYAAVVARAKREARGGMANDLALLIDQECPHEPDEHAEGTCEVCDYAFAMAQMVRDYAEAANDDHA